MNRVKITPIKESTSIVLSELNEMLECTPYTSGWISEKFPVYPILINFHIANPPFNCISISIVKPYVPSQLIFEGSADSKEFFIFKKLDNFTEEFIVINLEEHHHYKYLRIKILEPSPSEKINMKSNVCQQVGIRALQISFVTFYGCEYVCSMEKALKFDPALFSLLEMLEYKALVAKKRSKTSSRSEQLRQISHKYYTKIDNILSDLKLKTKSFSKLSEELRSFYKQEFDKVQKEPLEIYHAQSKYYDREGVQNELQELQGELSEFYIHRLNALHKDVTDYFYKYWNKEVKEEYLRYLSSTDNEDHGKALANFWAEVKNIQEFTPILEEAIVMFFNYFLEYTHDPLKINAIKIMCMLFRNEGLHFKPFFVYERVLFNLYSQLSDEERESLFEISLKCIYTLFKRIPDSMFLQCLLNPEHSIKTRMKLIKLEILERLTFRNVHIDPRDREIVVEYLLDILNIKEITLVDKNRAYNVIAYLASIFGKDSVMRDFEKLNTMLTISMEKIVDKKLLLLKNPQMLEEEEIPTCEHCNVSKASFKDPNIYDLHCYKDCKYLTPCKYCNQIIEIPELYKHYIHTCEQRNIFKECEECNETIVKANEEQHKEVCPKMLLTKCPLCESIMENKLRLKEHILKDGCPNNPRL